MGKADTFANKVFWPNSALYVLFASPEDTIPPTEAGTEVLNVYGGVVKVGVDRMKLGRVVAMVSELAEIKERMSSGVCVVAVIFVLFWRGYKPIKGGSFPLIPKLKIEYTVRRKAVPICQSSPSELGGRAIGHDRHKFGFPAAWPIM